jgi:transposase
MSGRVTGPTACDNEGCAGWTGAEKKLGQDGRPLVVCYEAGPCGYGIYRQLLGKPGVTCEVVAPSLIPRRSGDRVKTNRRDALAPARLRRAEELTAVWVPDDAHEAIRDLIRARAAAVSAMIRCQQQISSFRLRQRVAYVGGKPWITKHRRLAGHAEVRACGTPADVR